jgi:hypothetical protein
MRSRISKLHCNHARAHAHSPPPTRAHLDARGEEGHAAGAAADEFARDRADLLTLGIAEALLLGWVGGWGWMWM